MRAPCCVNLILPDPLTVRHNILHILQIMIILITQLAPPLLLFLLSRTIQYPTPKTTKWYTTHLFYYLFTEVAPYCDKPCKYQAPRNEFNHMRLPSDVAAGMDRRFGQKISLHVV
jgi:hypothetical protein